MKLKTINVISFADDNLASFRLRQKVIAEWINSNSDEWRMVISKLPDPDAEINLFHKHHYAETFLTWAKILRRTSDTKIIFDVTDNFFYAKEYASFYREMCSVAHMTVVSSFGLEEILENEIYLNVCYVEKENSTKCSS